MTLSQQFNVHSSEKTCCGSEEVDLSCRPVNLYHYMTMAVLKKGTSAHHYPGT